MSSLIEQLPRSLKLVDLAPPRPMLTVNAVWRRDHEIPAIERLFETAKRLGEEGVVASRHDMDGGSHERALDDGAPLQRLRQIRALEP